MQEQTSQEEYALEKSYQCAQFYCTRKMGTAPVIVVQVAYDQAQWLLHFVSRIWIIKSSPCPCVALVSRELEHLDSVDFQYRTALIYPSLQEQGQLQWQSWCLLVLCVFLHDFRFIFRCPKTILCGYLRKLRLSHQSQNKPLRLD